MIHIAWEGVVRNKIRSLLTMLGIIIGVAAVIIMVAISAGTEATIAEQIEGLGANLIFIQAGFSRCDIAELGPTVVVTTNGQNLAGKRIAEELMDYCWQTRSVWSDPLVTIDQAVASALAQPAGKPPLVLGDYGDAPGGGSYGDSTRLLSALLLAGIRNGALAAIYDPTTARQALDPEVGATIDVAVGGHSDPSLMANPTRARAWACSASAIGGGVSTGPHGAATRSSFGSSACLDMH